MTSQTLTLTKALVELKMISKQIEKKIDSMEPIAVKKGKKFDAKVKSQAEFESNAKANWQSLKDLIVRRRKIKTALVMANATTEVEVAGENMTIAEAIERKSMMSIEKHVVRTLRRRLALAQEEIDEHNHVMEEKLMRLLEATFAKREAQISKDDYQQIAQPFHDSNEAILVDPLNCKKTVEALETALEEFLAEVDVCLSIANAKTTIVID